MKDFCRVGRLGILATVAILTGGSALSCGEASLPNRLRVEDFTKRVGSADIVLIEFGDFRCPFCGRQATGVQPVIQQRFVETGELSYAYVHFPRENLHPEAFAASEAAECAGSQGRYWEMHRRLFENAERLMVADLSRHAQGLGLELEDFERCMAGEAAERVRADRRLGLELGVRAVPTFFLGTVQADGSVMVTAPFFGTAPPEVVSSMLGRLRAVERPWWPW